MVDLLGGYERHQIVCFVVFTSYGSFANTDCRQDNVTITTALPLWWERYVIAGFRVWQILFLILAGIISIVVFLCCFMKCRIPRTKQEIEADHTRKKLTRRFRCFLDRLTMDDMNLTLALVKVKELCDADEINQSEETNNQSEDSKTNQSEESLSSEKQLENGQNNNEMKNSYNKGENRTETGNNMQGTKSSRMP